MHFEIAEAENKDDPAAALKEYDRALAIKSDFAAAHSARGSLYYQMGKPESALAKAKVKAGHSAILTLRPKPAFVARLTAAKRILVRETVLVGGKTETRYLKLPVVR